MSREPLTTSDADAQEAAFEAYRAAREAARPVAHEHAYARNGPVLACFCGTTVSQDEVDR